MVLGGDRLEGRFISYLFYLLLFGFEHERYCNLWKQCGIEGNIDDAEDGVGSCKGACF